MTQLYVSVDASTEQSLKKIDRPLFKDFWPRFLNSLRALSEKVHTYCTCSTLMGILYVVWICSGMCELACINACLVLAHYIICNLPSHGPVPLTCLLPPQGQRTVYRLTLVKEWNTEELDAYAELVGVGKPDFIEVKVSWWQCCPILSTSCCPVLTTVNYCTYIPLYAL